MDMGGMGVRCACVRVCVRVCVRGVRSRGDLAREITREMAISGGGDLARSTSSRKPLAPARALPALSTLPRASTRESSCG